MNDAIVVDANPLLSALLGGQAREVLFCGKLAFYSPQHALFEMEKYLPTIAEKIGQTELALFREFQLLPVVAVQPVQYDLQLERALALIGRRDPKDAQVLKMDLPIWSEDRDFEGIPDVTDHAPRSRRRLNHFLLRG